mmetsp:Transcript_29590/g.39349  ORF Transcript_29590/g.39349 Transcript_29590/m.39349 type:complete len:532 (+) Transcript_29590:115-1710(+)|eukprot:CAMPEP_0185585618 /NCGR_PEP_ID=MMETSP0434-20130131/39784_1 /TAXON_ID=626734 ORGANISM="Favella taraikaensis, Strain Fe Narragansett Bay" /NCGR_SAMPLE_ID=MMETSP0434 /ASSEMBLY_ACC=CAM_ASM_000379 /LENGTH=531 /DNA_ID=CAMNT_0028206075 /DNA_START=99 /DNA_END=1694 /DNA_ORIENTATION=-
MKKEYLSAIFALFSLASFGQSTAQVDANNVNATIQDDGFFFNNSQTASSGYEVPAGSGIHAIYTGSFWFAGKDVNGQLLLAAQQFESNGADYTAGPTTRYADQYQDAALSTSYFGQTIWEVTKAEIDDHIANFSSSTYTMPNDIANWPAHGDTTLGSSSGMLPFIAPFVDVNGNGTYDPANGDYPCIKGDLAVYTIMNDAGLHFGSSGQPINMELHFMFYQYTSIPELENTTFIDVEVVNMGTQTLFDTRASFFLDPDLGNYNDDYIGTDTTRNMVYVYNADDFDFPNMGQQGYGSAPPAVGMKVLSHELSASISYTNAGVAPMIPPSQPAEYYFAMNGDYADNSSQLDGNGNPTDFAYAGDPNVLQSWSEYQQSTVPGDRRFVASLDAGVFGPDFSQGASDRRSYSYAVIYARGTDHLNSVAELQSAADFVQNHYDNMMNNCFDSQVAQLSEETNMEFTVSPNPTNGEFTIDWPAEEAATVEIFDAQGRKVHVRAIYSGKNLMKLILKSGVYFVNINSERGAAMQRLIVR